MTNQKTCFCNSDYPKVEMRYRSDRSSISNTKCEDFANRPFDKLCEYVTTPKYKLDRSTRDILEDSHIKNYLNRISHVMSGPSVITLTIQLKKGLDSAVHQSGFFLCLESPSAPVLSVSKCNICTG